MGIQNFSRSHCLDTVLTELTALYDEVGLRTVTMQSSGLSNIVSHAGHARLPLNSVTAHSWQKMSANVGASVSHSSLFCGIPRSGAGPGDGLT